MSILLDENNKIAIQGITGKVGRRLAKEMSAYGSKVVAGVTPGKGGMEIEGIPVFDLVKEAVQETGADSSLILVPARLAKNAIIESIKAGVKLIVYLGEGFPSHDFLSLNHLLNKDFFYVGGNTPGIISPGKSKIGFMPNFCYRPGPVGVISKSGSLSYQVCLYLSEANIGQSTVIGIGGDALKGMSVLDAIKLFNEDSETECIVLLGEIGGTEEIEAAEHIKNNMIKKVVASITGRTAVAGKRMGHAGALISGKNEDYLSKVNKLEESGVMIAKSPVEIPKIVKGLLQ